MTLEEVRRKAEQVLAKDEINDDPEGAHAEQDDLWLAVLKAVAANHPDSAAMAAECIRIGDSPGIRWFA